MNKLPSATSFELSAELQHFETRLSQLVPESESAQNAELNRRIMYRIGEGETDKAIDDIITIFRLGQHLQKDGFLVGCLVGSSIQWYIGFPAAVHMLRESNPSREQIERLASELDKLPNKISLSDLCLTEEYGMLEVISALSRNMYKFNLFTGDVQYGEPRYIPKLYWLNTFGYDWNHVARKAGKLYDRQTAIIKETNPVKRKKMRDELMVDLQQIEYRRTTLVSYWRMLFVNTRSDMMGDMIGKHFCNPLKKETISRLRMGEASVKLLRLACVLELYKMDNGRYPDVLNKLKGKYLNEIPSDPCSENDEPFRYRLEERTVQAENVEYGYFMYSVGKEDKDDGGKTQVEIPGTEDLYTKDGTFFNIPIRR